jgi:hypothetical protein
MRQLFEIASAWNGWSEADKVEFGAEIRRVAQLGDQDALESWQRWLEGMSGMQHLAEQCRALEQRVRLVMRKAA